MTLPMARTAQVADPAKNLYPVVLCGGSGKRLWPLSRQSHPKQFLRLNSGKSLLQDTVERALRLPNLSPLLLLCNNEHRFLVAEHMQEIGAKPLAIVCEPMSRNTAPALTTAALLLHEIDPEAIMLAMPSDHKIGDEAAFAQAVARATVAADHGRLTMFGIPPTAPETGYGYIRAGKQIDVDNAAHKVAGFEEKPSKERAEDILTGGKHLWNSGIFLFPVKTLLAEVEEAAPGLKESCVDALAGASRADTFITLGETAYESAPNISIDHAVLEHTDQAAVVRADMHWNDIGSWHALRDTSSTDDQGNFIEGNVLTDGVTNSYIQANGRLVAALGLDDIVVVDTDDAVLISDARHTARIDEMVRKLQEAGLPQASDHSLVRRPWGSYQTVDDGARFQVKHILVKPGEQLSLQMHHHRAEHWIVVTGTARVTCGSDTRLLGENEAVHIPLGTTHRLDNPGKIPLHLIEVQVGSYLGEDDIVRFEDTYGRA